MMGYIDTSKPANQYYAAPEQPRFFSGNVASLGQVLGRLRSVDVVVLDSGTQLRQQIVYHLQ
jgi:hypothetical protein